MRDKSNRSTDILGEEVNERNKEPGGEDVCVSLQVGDHCQEGSWKDPKCDGEGVHGHSRSFGESEVM